MGEPDGYVDPTYPDQVCCLLQTLYGLKQAPKMWYAKLVVFLKSQGFGISNPEACLYCCSPKSVLIDKKRFLAVRFL